MAQPSRPPKGVPFGRARTDLAHIDRDCQQPSPDSGWPEIGLRRPQSMGGLPAGIDQDDDPKQGCPKTKRNIKDHGGLGRGACEFVDHLGPKLSGLRAWHRMFSRNDETRNTFDPHFARCGVAAADLIDIGVGRE